MALKWQSKNIAALINYDSATLSRLLPLHCILYNSVHASFENDLYLAIHQDFGKYFHKLLKELIESHKANCLSKLFYVLDDHINVTDHAWGYILICHNDI